MPELKFIQVALSLKARVPLRVLEEHVPISIAALAEDLADQVMAQVRAEGLGYYPALDYFRDHGGVDDEALGLLDQVTWLAAEYLRREIRQQLRGIFSQVRIEGLQAMAFTMPRVRPGQLNHAISLTQHLNPSVLKADLHLGILQRRVTAEGLPAFARRMVLRWLGPQVDALDITQVHPLAEPQ